MALMAGGSIVLPHLHHSPETSELLRQEKQ
jgi:hypothetical protein